MWVVTLPSTPVTNDLHSQVRGLKGGRVDDGRRQVQEEGQEVDVAGGAEPARGALHRGACELGAPGDLLPRAQRARHGGELHHGARRQRAEVVREEQLGEGVDDLGDVVVEAVEAVIGDGVEPLK